MSIQQAQRPPPQPVHVMRSSHGEVTAMHSIVNSFCGHLLVTGHSSGELQLWDITIYRVQLSWSAHSNRIQWIGDLDDRLFSYGRDSLIHAWIINDNCPSKVLTLAVNCCNHCPCDLTRFGLLAMPFDDSSVSLRDVKLVAGEVTTNIQATSKRGMIMTIRFVTHKSKYLLVAYENGSLVTYRITDGSEVSSLQSTPSTEADDDGSPIVTCLDFHELTMKGISGSPGDRLNVFEVSDTGVLSLKTIVTITNPGVACVRVHPHGKYCVTGGWDHRIRVFSWKTLRLLVVIELHSATVQCLTFVRPKVDSDLLLAVGSQDGRMSLWNLYNEKESLQKNK